jgi:hypothetical protein
MAAAARYVHRFLSPFFLVYRRVVPCVRDRWKYVDCRGDFAVSRHQFQRAGTYCTFRLRALHWALLARPHDFESTRLEQ